MNFGEKHTAVTSDCVSFVCNICSTYDDGYLLDFKVLRTHLQNYIYIYYFVFYEFNIVQATEQHYHKKYIV